MTLNVAHGRALARSQLGLSPETIRGNLDEIVDVLCKADADVVALQEADGPSAWSGGFNHVSYLADRADYRHKYHGLHFSRGVGPIAVRIGTALLSKVPLAQASSIRFEANGLQQKGFVSARIDHAGRAVLLVSLHLYPDSRDIRRQQAHVVINYVRSAKLPAIVLGDFNCEWSDPSDALRIIADELNLTTFKPASKALNTFPSPEPLMRIDWILTSREIELTAYRNVGEGVSDHLGVVAEVRWAD